MRVRSRVLLFALVVAACARQITTVGHLGYTPKWRVGDWWIVKTWQPQPMSLRGEWGWNYMRYDVARIEKVEQQDCYVVEMRSGWGTNISSSGPPGRALYVRTVNWLLIREVAARFYSGKRVAPDVYDYPRGLFGPFISEPRLPRFPLQPASRDTAFEGERHLSGYAYLREISSVADPVMVRRVLNEEDTTAERAVRPVGVVYQVRNELRGDDITQSLQLWSDNQPWRLYEERVGYGGPHGRRSVAERSWLITVGHKGK